MSETVSAKPGPEDLLQSRRYVPLLIIAAILGVPVSVFAYFFLYLVTRLQHLIYTVVPSHFSSHLAHVWWPILPLTLCGLAVGLAVTKLRGRGGEAPIHGFNASGEVPQLSHLWGIGIAATVSIGFGAVIGPEGPLIALGGGLAYGLAHLIIKKLPPVADRLLSAAGSFAAVSTLLGSPLSSAFLLMEASSVSGLLQEVVLLPGILAAGIGYLIFVGLDSLTGFGLFSLTIPNLPAFGNPTIGQFVWAIIIGFISPVLVLGIRQFGSGWGMLVRRNIVLFTVLAGLATGLLAVLFTQVTGQNSAFILFSGQDQLPLLVTHTAALSSGALLLMLLLKGIAYAIALTSFRGGPTFPAIFLGTALGILTAHIFGLNWIAGIGIGVGAMTAAMLRLPLTAILVSTLLLGADGVRVMPLSIVAVVVAYVTDARLSTKISPQ